MCDYYINTHKFVYFALFLEILNSAEDAVSCGKTLVLLLGYYMRRETTKQFENIATKSS
jgi:hypothetical protein